VPGAEQLACLCSPAGCMAALEAERYLQALHLDGGAASSCISTRLDAAWAAQLQGAQQPGVQQPVSQQPATL